MITPAGLKDNLAVGAIMMGALLGMYWINLVPWFVPVLGGLWWGYRVYSVLAPPAIAEDDERFDDGGRALMIRSDRPPKARDGLLLGYEVQSGEPVAVPDEDLVRHMLIAGQTGVGKTVLGLWLMWQHIERGGGLLWIDGKLDVDNMTMLIACCMHAGRMADFRLINPDRPDMSNTYNPLLDGDPDEVAARIFATVPTSESNAASDYYYQSGVQALTTLIGAIQSTGNKYNFADLGYAILNPNGLIRIERMLDKRSEQYRAFHAWLQPYLTSDGKVDVKKIKDTFGGIGGRLTMFGSGKFGQILNHYDPEIRLYDAIVQNRIIYVALPTMGKQQTAIGMAKLLLGDMRTAIARVQSLPTEMRPRPPFMVFADEAGSYMTSAWARAFEQARSANIILLPTFQTKANLDAVDRELQSVITGNTQTKVFFRPGDPQTAEWMSAVIGKEVVTSYSIHGSISVSQTKPNRAVGAAMSSGSKGDSVGFAEVTSEQFRVAPHELSSLREGECVVVYRGSYVYHVKVPRLQFDEAIMRKARDYQESFAGLRFVRRSVKGLNLIETASGKEAA
jgi:hypothetical protein